MEATVVLNWTIGVVACGGIFVGLFFLKNEITFKCTMRIAAAINEYRLFGIQYGVEDLQVSFDDIKSYESVLWNPFIWGCKGILPNDKYEIIKPFIKGIRK